jgi:hypothetical protein
MIPILEVAEGYDGRVSTSIARSLGAANGPHRRRIGGAELAGSDDEGSRGLVQQHLRLRWPGGQMLGHEAPSPSEGLDQPVTLERAVCLRDGVRRELELLGERSDGRQTTAGGERPAVDLSRQRRRELIRERLRGTLIERDPHASIIPRPPWTDV